MSEKENRQTPNALAVCLGSVPFTASDVAGQPVEITVRLLKVSEFETFFTLIDREEELVAFATTATAEQVACLSPNTVLDLVDKIFELNFTTAQRWAERRAKLGSAAVSFQSRVTQASPT